MPTKQKISEKPTLGTSSSKIDTKNLELLSELMQIEALANKKNAYYSQSLKDEAVAELVKKHILCHKSRYESLLKYLESHK